MTVAALAALLLLPIHFHGQQVPLPPVDLGATSFLDGVGGPGFFIQEILSPFHASRFNGPIGEKLPGNNSVDAFAAITEVAYTSQYRLLGAYYGGEVLFPIVHADIQTDLGVRGAQTGFGDLIFSPFLLQWRQHKLLGKTFFQRLHIVELVVPTGRYDRNASVNIGNNVVSLGPHYAFTWFLSPRLETSWRLHYVWNSRNHDPNPVYNASSIQPGQAVHFNASLSYQFHQRVRAGVNGYYLKEVTDPRIGDHPVFDSREQIGAIGPGLWLGTKAVDIFLHAFFEMGAENRPQGFRFMVRIVKILPKNK
ncbi:MAG TPA: transporter [Candidatus Angelobacter sp.]